MRSYRRYTHSAHWFAIAVILVNSHALASQPNDDWLQHNGRDELLEVSRHLAKPSVEAWGERRRLRDRIAATFFAEGQEDITKLLPSEWLELVRNIGASCFYADDVSSMWSTGLSNAYMQRDLDLAEALALSQCLNYVGHGMAGDFIEKWTGSNSNWKKWPLTDLAQLLVNGTSRRRREAYATVIDHIYKQHLATPGQLVSTDIVALESIIQIVSVHMNGSTKTAWHKAIANKCDPSQMNGIELACLASISDSLGKPSVWGRFDRVLHGQLAGEPERFASVSPSQVARWLWNARADLRDEDQAQWAQLLAERYAEIPMTYEKLHTIYRLLSLLEHSNPRSFVAQWMIAQPSWRQWEVGDVCLLSTLVSIRDPACSEGIQVLRDFFQDICKDNSSILEIPVADIGCLMLVVRRIAPEKANTYRARIRDAFLPADLGVREILLLNQAFAGSQDIQFSSEWLAAHDTWHQWPLEDVNWIVDSIPNDELRADIRNAVYEVISERYLAASEHVASADALTLAHTARKFGSKMTDAEKGMIRDLIVERFMDKPVAAVQLEAVSEALGCLNEKYAADFVGMWLMQHDVWDQWSVTDLHRVVKCVRGNSSEAKKTRQFAINIVKDKYYRDVEAIKSSSLREIRDLSSLFVTILDNKELAVWYQKVRQACVTRDLSPSELVTACSILSSINPGIKDIFVSDWMCHTPSWRNWRPKDLVQLAIALNNKSNQSVRGRNLLIQHITDKYMLAQDEMGEIDDRTWRDLVRPLALHLPGDHKDLWISRLCNWFITQHHRPGITARDMLLPTNLLLSFHDERIVEFVAVWCMDVYETEIMNETNRQNIQHEAIHLTAEYLELAGMTGDGQDYPEFADALIGFAQRGLLKHTRSMDEYHYLAVPLGSQESRLRVRSAITDKEGNVILGLVKVLTNAHKYANEIPEWLAFLQLQSEAANLSNDVKAQWFLALASAHATLTYPPSPLAGQQWYDKALSLTESNNQKEQIVSMVLDGFHQMHNHVGGQDYIEAVKKQYPDLLHFCDRAAVSFRAQARKHQDRAEQQQRDHEMDAHSAHLAEIEQRFKLAMEEGDEEAVRRYQLLINAK